MFKNLTVKARLFALIAFMISMMAIIGFIGLKGMSDSNAGLQTVYVDRTIPLDQLAEITDLTADSIIHLHLAGMYDPRLPESNLHSAPINSHLDRIEKNNQDALKIWEAYMATYLTPEEKKLAEQYVKLRDEFIKDKRTALEMYTQKRFSEGNEFMIKTVSPKFAALNEKVDELKSLQVDVAKSEFDKATSSYATTRNIAIAMMLLAISLGLTIGYILVRNLVQSLGAEPSEVADLAAFIARGKLNNDLKIRAGDNRSVMANMKVMQDSINAFVAGQGEMAQKHADGWISEQMDEAKFPGTFGKMAKEVNDLVNSHISVKMQIVKVITEYANGNFSSDMEKLPGEKAKISDAIDNVKKTLLAISNEIKTLAETGVRGDFSKRSEANNYQFVFKDILTDINELFETCDTAFNDVSRVTEALSKGDLTKTITRDYPGTFGIVKESVNSTIDNLRKMIEEIQQSTEIINTAAKEIASGNNNLSQRAEEQAASLEETASSMEELTSTVKENAQNAQSANQVSANAREKAEKGGAIVHSAVKAMQEINESSNKIAAIIGVIDEIAFQTNLLALNASVEAARAGEHGRGFSVVATEVRNLAQRSATAARESKALIQNSIQKVRVGTEFVNETGQSLTEIVNGVKEVSGIVSDIASASIQQTAGIEQVNQAVSQMDEITQQNAALAEQASAASVAMTEQTANMSQLLSFFQIADTHFDANYRSAAVKPAAVSSITKSPAPVRVAAVPRQAVASIAASNNDDEWDEF